MDGSTELARLAELLRIGAQAARVIADARRRDAPTIERLASQAEDMAHEIETLIDTPDAEKFGMKPLDLQYQ